MKQAAHGDRVTISYIGTLDNGRIFDSTEDRPALEFRIGDGEVFPALETAVIGMKVGEARNVVIPAAEAFGPRLEANMLKVSRHLFAAEKEIVVGQKLQIDFSGGKSRVMMVAEIAETSVTLNGNHPLAGLDLTFALRVDDINGA